MNFMSRSKQLSILWALILLAFLSACNQSSKPIIYGVWEQYESPLSSVNRIDSNGTNNAVIHANTKGISVFQFITKHNYASPVSPDGKLIAVYSLADDGFWELQLRTTQVEQGEALFVYPVGTQLSRFIEGFSPSSKYYTFTSQDPDTGILSVQIFDVAAKSLLETIPGAFFVDYFPESDNLVILSIGPDGAVAGVQQVAIADQSINKLYEPPAEEQIGFMHVTQDGKSLLIYDIATKLMSKIEFGSGEHTPIYQYEGTNNAGNFDPNGNYLMLTDLSQEKQLVVLLDDNLAEVIRVESIQSGFISFSENAQYFCYMLDAGEKLELLVKDIKAGTAYSITAEGVFYRSDFSPDSKHIVFIEYKEETDKTGELFAAAVDGSSKTLLDGGVTSFDFSDNNTIVYFKINEESGSPVSSMIRIDFEGKNKTELLSSQPGIFSFIR